MLGWGGRGMTRSHEIQTCFCVINVDYSQSRAHDTCWKLYKDVRHHSWERHLWTRLPCRKCAGTSASPWQTQRVWCGRGMCDLPCRERTGRRACPRGASGRIGRLVAL